SEASRRESPSIANRKVNPPQLGKRVREDQTSQFEKISDAHTRIHPSSQSPCSLVIDHQPSPDHVTNLSAYLATPLQVRSMDVNKEAGHSMSFRIQRTMGQSGTPSYLRQNRIASYTAMFGSSPVGKRHQADLCNEHVSVRILGLSGAHFRGTCFDQYSCLSNAFTELARESRLIQHDFLVKPHRLGEFACSPALTLHLVAFGLI